MNSATYAILRGAQRHPNTALSIAALAALRRKETTKLIRLARQTSSFYAQMSEAAVQDELRAAIVDFAQVIERAQAIGPRQIVGDKKLARQSDAAIKHLSKALANARKKKRHRARWTLVAIGLSAGAAFGVWKLTQNSLLS